MLPTSPFKTAARKIQLAISALTSCNFILLLVSFGFNSQISILVQLLRFPEAFINVAIIAFASLKTPLSIPRATAAAGTSNRRGRSKSRRRRSIVLSCCSACLILLLLLLAGLILPSAAKTGALLFLILGALNVIIAALLCADAVLMDMHRRREKKSASATTSSSSSSYSSSYSASDTDHQQQHPQIHVYQPRLSLTSDRVVAGTTLSVSPEDAGDTELEPLPKYQQQEPEHQAPTIIIDLANLEPGQPQPHQHHLAVGRTSSLEQGDINNNNNNSGSSSSSSRSSSSNRGQGHPTLERAESDPRRTSWEDVEMGIVPEYSQVTATGHTAAERSASVLLPSPTTTRSTADDYNHVHNRDSGTPPAGGPATPSNTIAVTAAADNTPGSIESFVPASEPTSAPPVYAP